MEMKIKYLNFRDIVNFGQEIFSVKQYSDLLSRLVFFYIIKYLLYVLEILFLGIDYRELKIYLYKMCLGIYILDKMLCLYLFFFG